MEERSILMPAPFLKAKRALFFSKFIHKNCGAELVVSENHRSGALFHFKENRQTKREVLPAKSMDAQSTYQKRRSKTNEEKQQWREKGRRNVRVNEFAEELGPQISCYL